MYFRKIPALVKLISKTLEIFVLLLWKSKKKPIGINYVGENVFKS